MGICLTTQTPKCVFTKHHARMSIFFASILRATMVGERTRLAYWFRRRAETIFF